MKSYILFLAFAVFLTSCSSVYKSGQTPDDVYFSPERERDEYVRVSDRNERYYRNEEIDREDRYLRMKARNRRYGLLDNDYDYYSYNGVGSFRYNDYYRMNAFRYNQNWWMWNNHRFGAFYNLDPFFHNPYYFNPYYNNPYYSGVVYGNVNPRYNRPRTTNLHVFDGNNNNYNSNLPKGNGRTYSNGSDRIDNYRGSGSNAGGFMRDVFGGGNNNSSSGSNVGQTSTNSSNSGSSSSGSSGSGRAPVRKF